MNTTPTDTVANLCKALESAEVLEYSATPQEWLTALKTTSLKAKESASKRGKSSIGMILCILSAVIFGTLGPQKFPLVLGTILSAAGFLFFLIALLSNSKNLLTVYSSTLLNPIIHALKEDMKPNALLKIHLDASKSTDGNKLVDTQKVPKHELPRRVVSRTNMRYNDPWLSLSGKFIDQTSFRVSSLFDVKKTKVTKRSASGKTKFKSKHKYKETLKVILKPPSKATMLHVESPPNIECSIKNEGENFTISATSSKAAAHSPAVSRKYEFFCEGIFEVFAHASQSYKLS